MDQKQAYCCLNCTNCCETCGECPACCEDCGDTSNCWRSRAYFNGSNFYKDFIFTAINIVNYNVKNVDTRCEGGKIIINSRIITEYSTLRRPGKECSVMGRVYSNVNMCPNGGGYSYLTSYNGTTYNRKRLCNGSYEINYGDGDCVEGIIESGNTNCPNFNITDDCPGYEKECQGLSCHPTCGEYAEEDCEGSASRSNSARVHFVNQLNLYNSKGELANIGEAYAMDGLTAPSYNPCNPLATWFAPGCHFFYLG